MPDYIDVRSSGFAILKDSKSYVVSDEDESSDPKYYGFLSYDGTWIIMEHTASSGSYRFASGHEDYTTNYTNRASLTYKYYNQLP